MTQQLTVPTKHFTVWMQEGIQTHGFGGERYQQTKRLVLANGVSLSIQASSTHYCSPRISTQYSQYSKFEVGFPSHRIEALMPYCDDTDNPTGTVYAYVPLEVLEQYIASAGGVIGYFNKVENDERQ